MNRTAFSCCLNGYENWSLIPTGEHRLRVAEKGELQKISGFTGEEDTGGSFSIRNSRIFSED
jgi:hypothetical protein